MGACCSRGNHAKGCWTPPKLQETTMTTVSNKLMSSPIDHHFHRHFPTLPENGKAKLTKISSIPYLLFKPFIAVLHRPFLNICLFPSSYKFLPVQSTLLTN